ncbi:permease [Patescibacteria group bacterium]|nr:permease [Patescibacteria group bacterium]
MTNIVKKIGGGWVFFIIAFLICTASAIINPALTLPTLIALGQLLEKVVPILIFVFILIFLFNLWLKPEAVVKYLSKQSGIKGWLLAIGGGIISMGAIYMWYPLLSDLKAKGMDNSLIATFLYNRAIKPQLLPFLIYYFGWAFTIIMTIYMIIFSVINGWAVDKLVDLSREEK